MSRSALAISMHDFACQLHHSIGICRRSGFSRRANQRKIRDALAASVILPAANASHRKDNTTRAGLHCAKLDVGGVEKIGIRKSWYFMSEYFNVQYMGIPHIRSLLLLKPFNKQYTMKGDPYA